LAKQDSVFLQMRLSAEKFVYAHQFMPPGVYISSRNGTSVRKSNLAAEEVRL
jgi:hypothetical protein